MKDPKPNTATGPHLTCPACDEPLSAVPGMSDMLGCPANHLYTLPNLLCAQSIQAGALIEAGARLLEEQKHLVRAIAQELWDSQSLAAFKLEGQAERLKETTDTLRRIVTDTVLQSQPLTEANDSSN
jgi:hypothetical protein